MRTKHGEFLYLMCSFCSEPIRERAPLGPLLGTGSFGVVYRARTSVAGIAGLPKNSEVALKMIGYGAGFPASVARVFVEHVSLRRLAGVPNVVQSHEDMFLTHQHDGGETACMLMHCMPGNLHERVCSTDPAVRATITDLQRIQWAEQALSAVQAVHEIGMLHRDIKTDNFLLDTNNQVHLGDFGLARLLHMSQSIAAGALAFKAPETMIAHNNAFETANQAQSAYGTASDMFSMAIVMWVIFTGNGLPFGESTHYLSVGNAILAGVRPPRLPEAAAPLLHRAEVWNLLMLCWHQDPAQRLSAAEARQRLGRVRERYYV